MNKRIILVLLSSVVAILIVVLGFMLYQKSSSNDNSTSKNTSTSEEKMSLQPENNSQLNNDKDSVIEISTNLLTLSMINSDEDIEQVLGEIESGDYSSFDKDKVDSFISFDDVFLTDEGLRNNTYQILVTLSSQVSKSGSIVPDALGANYVYVDNKAEVAYVPLGVFTGNPGSVSLFLEFSKIDGEWKLMPYSLHSSVSLTSQLGGM